MSEKLAEEEKLVWVLVEKYCVRCGKPEACIVKPYGLECIPCWSKFRDAKPD